MNTQEDLIRISNEARTVFDALDNENIITAHMLLHPRIVNPQSFVTFIGETSSGKSTIINGLFDYNLLLTKATPTTGTVTQIIINNNNKEQKYLCINKDGTIEPIDKKMFDYLIVKPDDQVLRLQTELSQVDKRYNGLNIFDTPGYNSLVVEHEEVLKTFIPESDIIVHVISYRMGFGEQDQLLLSSVYDQIESRDTPVILAINRCPEDVSVNSKRIIEIIEHAKETLHREMKVILVPSVIQEDLNNPKEVLPKSIELWNTISNIVSSKEQKQKLSKQISILLKNLLKEQRLNLDTKLGLLELDQNELHFFEEQLNEFVSTKEQLINLIEKFSTRWYRQLPTLLEDELSQLINTCGEEINKGNKWLDSNACTAYISGHHIPYGLRQVNKTVTNYFSSELEELNKEMEDLANQAIKKLSTPNMSKPSASYHKILQTLIASISQRLLGETSKNLVIGLGGRGGVAAGMGNLTKMVVKRFGNLFGKTFSREVYTNIGKFFTKKMIARINVIVTVAIEGFVYVYESKTWQKKLTADVTKKLEEFKKEAKTEIINDTIFSIKNSNTNAINELFDDLHQDTTKNIEQIRHGIDNSKIEEINKQLSIITKLEKQLGE